MTMIMIMLIIVFMLRTTMAIMMMMTSRADNLFPRLACAPKYATTPREASNALVKRVMSRSMHWLKLMITKLMKKDMELMNN